MVWQWRQRRVGVWILIIFQLECGILQTVSEGGRDILDVDGIHRFSSAPSLTRPAWTCTPPIFLPPSPYCLIPGKLSCQAWGTWRISIPQQSLTLFWVLQAPKCIAPGRITTQMGGEVSKGKESGPMWHTTAVATMHLSPPHARGEWSAVISDNRAWKDPFTCWLP